MNTKTFIVDTISDSDGKMAMLSGLTDFEFGEGEELGKYKFGLNCKKYEQVFNGIRTEVILSTDIEMPIQKLDNEYPKDQGILVESTSVDPSGLKLIFGIKSFSPQIIDTTLLSIDTSAHSNMNKAIKEMNQAFEEVEKESKEEEERFGKIKPETVNVDLIKNLIRDGAIDSTIYDRDYMKGDYRIDVPNVLLKNKSKDYGFQFMPSNQIKQILEENNILTPFVEILLKSYSSELDKLSTEIKFNAICIAAIKDHLSHKKTKRQLADNLFGMAFFDSIDQNLNEEFILGNISYTDYLSETNVLNKLNNRYATSDQEILDNVKDFFHSGLEDIEIRPQFIEEGDLLKITIAEESYQIILSNLKEKNYEGFNYDDENATILYKDTTAFDKDFYNNLKGTLKQIAADNNLEMTYSILELKPPFIDNLMYQHQEYQEVISLFPELIIDINAIYINKFPKIEYEPLNTIGISFPFHPDAYYKELRFINFREGDIDAGFSYIQWFGKELSCDFTKVKQITISFVYFDQLSVNTIH